MSPGSPFRVACVQLTSRANVDENLGKVADLCDQAGRAGADLTLLPENFAFVGKSEEEKFAVAEALPTAPTAPGGPILEAVRAIARRTGMWILGGGMPERGPDAGHVHNTMIAVAPDGALVARYRKVHLFDVSIPGGAEFQESRTVAPGSDAIVLETPMAKVGLSICYDLRFPELYRELTRRGARVLVVPAAFTLHTGKDHWHTLLRARAIENQAWVLAAGQVGRHDEKRVTYGHSLVIDPWGQIVAEASDREQVIVAEIDLAFQDKVRRELPCLDHRRL